MSAITPMWIVVAVIPTSLAAGAAPVPAVEVPVAPLAGAAVVEVPLGWLGWLDELGELDELHAPATKTTASIIPGSAKERALTKRPGAKMALILRATALLPAMVILPFEDSCTDSQEKLHWWAIFACR
jgi:hypothetical protein